MPPFATCRPASNRIARHMVAAAIAFTLATLVSFVRPGFAGNDRPNILFIVSDDQRADTISAYGNAHIQTPQLDRLVNEGFSFRAAYCMGAMQGAVCLPSRAMFNSGRSLFRAPKQLDGVPILPEVLAKSGYTTFGTGKWHNGAESFERGFRQGKAVFLGGMSNHLAVPVREIGEDGRLGNAGVGDKFSSELFADAAIEFLESHPKEMPFYCYVSFTAPHDPRMPPAAALDHYRSQPPPVPPNFLPQHPFHNGWMVGRDEVLAPWPRTETIIRNQLAEYYGMISHMDAQIGRILEALDSHGHAERTIVVFTSDHGLAMGSHGLLGKQNLYDHSMRAPLIIRGPGIPANRSSEALVYLFDIMPTILSLAGVDLPAKVDGRDLRAIMTGSTSGVRDSVFTVYEDVQRAIRDERWKLILYPQINRRQLFDLSVDPHEMDDLSEREEYVDEIHRLIGRLRRWQRDVGDEQVLTVAMPESERIDLTGRQRKPDRHQPPEIVRKYFGAEATP